MLFNLPAIQRILYSVGRCLFFRRIRNMGSRFCHSRAFERRTGLAYYHLEKTAT